jgi:hypothetical protein
MSDDKETEIQKMKRLGTKEYIRQLNEAKSKMKQEKDFNKTGQYAFKLDPETNKKGGSIKKKVNKLLVGGLPDPSTIVSTISTATPQDYINYKTNTAGQSSTQPEESTGYKAVKFETKAPEKVEEKSKGGLVYTKPFQKKYYGGLI